MYSSGIVRVVHFLYVCGCWDTPSPFPLRDNGYVSPIYVYIMAIINSLAIGKSYKSAGNLTYKTVRGRTIASQRITTNSSKSALQVFQRGSFSDAVKCMQLVLPWINNFFDKSKYGSSRNNFLKLCKSYNMGGDRNLIVNGTLPLADGFLKGLAVTPGGDNIVGTSPYTSYGSAPVIVSGSRSINNYAYGDAQADVWEYSQGVSFSFPTPIAEDKVELLIGGFNLNGASKFDTIPFSVSKYNATSDAISAISALGLTVTVTATEGLVSKLLVAPKADAETDVQNSIYVVTVRVNGKVATTDAIIIVPTTPLP